jgi:hypothetical protein
MGDIYTDFEKEEKDDIDLNDDTQIDVINNLKTDEDVEAAKALINEELANPETGTSASSVSAPGEGMDTQKEPKPPEAFLKDRQAGAKDTSGEASDKTALAEKSIEDVKNNPPGTGGITSPQPLGEKSAGDFILSEDKINSYPEEVRGILNKYKGKSRAEIEKAIANAVIFKTGQDPVQALIDTQKETGKVKQEQPLKPAAAFPEPGKLPPLEENEEVNKAISAEAVKRLRLTKFPDMPDNLNSGEGKNWANAAALRQLRVKYPGLPLDPDSPEYQQFIRAMQDENLEKADEFFYDKRQAVQNIQNEFVNASFDVKKDLQQLIYVQGNYKNINNARLENEVEAIKKELDQLGLTEKDLGIDLNLQKDESGALYNEHLSPMMLNGETADSNVIGFFGQFPILKENKLREKFLYANNIKILNLLAGRRVQDSQKETERLKDSNLNTLGGSRSSGATGDALTLDKINSLTDEGALKKEKARLEDILSKG